MNYDIIIVGAGHAGVEAANICNKNKLKTALITLDKNSFSVISCNPSIGGLAKGHIVREIDALGGIMPSISDRCGIQFRMLNLSKGPAVWGPRAQIDKVLYEKEAKDLCYNMENVDIIIGKVKDLIYNNNKCSGVILEDGNKLESKSVILTCGTFLNSLIHIGTKKIKSGRLGEDGVEGLSDSLKNNGIEVLNLKTGTPARIYTDSVDFTNLTEQKGDKHPQTFSFYNGINKIELNNNSSCFLTRTNLNTHKILKDNFHLSPMVTGEICSTGPRYCPSIETKLIRFNTRESHQLFIEPESNYLDTIYLNGLSNCMPEEVQIKVLQSIEGLENCKMKYPAYAVEYDYFPSTQNKATLESKKIENLYFAGQINGTSGYEEAAAQGLIAAINCCNKIKNKKEFVLKRHEAYIGVLIDDLVTKGTREPYRMFTSSAEYRLLLRHDNADKRLIKYGYELGLIDKLKYEESIRKWKFIEKSIFSFKDIKVKIKDINPILVSKGMSPQKESKSVYNLLKRPEIKFNEISQLIDIELDRETSLSVETEIKYEGYIKKESETVKRFQSSESVEIPSDIDYDKIKGLNLEAVEKLKEVKPQTIGQASRIGGVNPSHTDVLIIYLKYYYGKNKTR